MGSLRSCLVSWGPERGLDQSEGLEVWRGARIALPTHARRHRIAVHRPFTLPTVHPLPVVLCCLDCTSPSRVSLPSILYLHTVSGLYPYCPLIRSPPYGTSILEYPRTLLHPHPNAPPLPRSPSPSLAPHGHAHTHASRAGEPPHHHREPASSTSPAHSHSHPRPRPPPTTRTVPYRASQSSTSSPLSPSITLFHHHITTLLTAYHHHNNHITTTTATLLPHLPYTYLTPSSSTSPYTPIFHLPPSTFHITTSPHRAPRNTTPTTHHPPHHHTETPIDTLAALNHHGPLGASP